MLSRSVYGQTNDKWNAQNKTNQVTGAASLARNRIKHNNDPYSATRGGPVWRDHVRFFGAYEKTSGIFGQSVTVEALYGQCKSKITAAP